MVVKGALLDQILSNLLKGIYLKLRKKFNSLLNGWVVLYAIVLNEIRLEDIGLKCV